MLCICMDRDQFKSLVVKMYRSYVQEDGSLAASSKAVTQDKKINMEDPQQATLTYKSYLHYLSAPTMRAYIT